jgi:microcystin-dependent protein
MKCCDNDDYKSVTLKSENNMMETYIDDSSDKPIFILNDENGNMSTFNPMTETLNSDWKIKGKLCIENVCVNENDIKSPVGIIIPFAGDTIPPFYLICDGRSLLKSEYPELFQVLGNKYGENSLNFNIPDLRGRTIVGTGNGNNLTNRILGTTGGSENETLTIQQMPSHTHTGNTDPGGNHFHSLSILTDSGSGNMSPHLSTSNTKTGYYTMNTSPVANHSHNFITNSVGGGSSHNNMPPFIVLNYIIKAK